MRSLLLALGLGLLATAWVLSGTLARGEDPPAALAPAGGQGPVEREPTALRVRVVELTAEDIPTVHTLHGAFEPRRRVTLRAETTGRVVDVPVPRGTRVAAGALLVQLAADERPARLAAAEAEILRLRRDLAAERTMDARGLQAATRLRAVEAQLAAAEAERAALAVDLERTRIRAPFPGVLERRPVEVGSLLERGDTIAELVEDDVLLAVGEAPQSVAASIARGQPVEVRLLGGRRATGEVSYVARTAEPATRSFRVEAEVEDAGHALRAGESVAMDVEVGRRRAHRVSPAALALDDAGRVGVKTVGVGDRVVFAPVEVVATGAAGAWIAGLPERVRVIVEGQGFVADGAEVVPVVDPPPDRS